MDEGFSVCLLTEGVAIVVEHLPLTLKVGRSTHGLSVNCHNTHWAIAFTSTVLARSKNSGFSLPQIAITKIKNV